LALSQNTQTKIFCHSISTFCKFSSSLRLEYGRYIDLFIARLYNYYLTKEKYIAYCDYKQ